MLTSVSRSLLLLCFSFFWIDKLVFLFCAVSHKSLVESRQRDHSQQGWEPQFQRGELSDTPRLHEHSRPHSTLSDHRSHQVRVEFETRPHDTTKKPINGAFLEGNELPLVHKKLGWWNIIFIIYIYNMYIYIYYIHIIGQMNREGLATAKSLDKKHVWGCYTLHFCCIDLVPSFISTFTWCLSLGFYWCWNEIQWDVWKLLERVLEAPPLLYTSYYEKHV